MKKNTGFILEELKTVTRKALKEGEAKSSKDKQQIKQENEEGIKKEADEIYGKMMTDKKLLATAERGVGIYPILLIVESDSLHDCPVKNRKTGYQYNIGELGRYVFEKLVENDFTPVLIQVSSYDLEEYKPNNSNWVKPFNEEIVRPGFYLGIEWASKYGPSQGKYYIG